jgi:RimJ/RimL family protein N-acetyltransferase
MPDGPTTPGVLLSGAVIRLEPLDHRHLPGLMAAAGADPALYAWTAVPQGVDEVARYIEIAVAWRDAGTATPFAIIRNADNVVIGSTRFWNLERWAWPPGHPRHGLGAVDVCEIGHTWLTASSIRTAANTEAKLLMLTHAFETWRVLRVCFHTDARNSRSAAALERIGAGFEGVLRAHRLAADHVVRDSLRFSIIAAEWADVRARLRERLRAVA